MYTLLSTLISDSSYCAKSAYIDICITSVYDSFVGHLYRQSGCHEDCLHKQKLQHITTRDAANSGRFGNLPLINYLLKTTGWQQLARRRVAANDVFTCLSSLTSALSRWQIETGQCYFLTGNVSVETSICSSWGEVAVAKRHTRIQHTEAQRASSLHIMCSHRPVAVSSYSFSVWGS